MYNPIRRLRWERMEAYGEGRKSREEWDNVWLDPVTETIYEAESRFEFRPLELADDPVIVEYLKGEGE